MSQSGPSADTPTEAAVQASHQTMPHHAAIQPTNQGAQADPAVGEDFDGLARQLFLGHSVPMWVCDGETLRITEVNDAAIDTYGYSRAEFLAMLVTDIRPAEDAERLRERIASIEPGSARLQRPDEGWRHIYKDGSVHVVDVMSRRLTYAGRTADLVMVTDVTERVRTERERDALLERLGHEVAQRTAILEQMTDAVLVTDTAGHVLLANQAAQELYQARSALP